MYEKLKQLSWLPILALIFGSIWAYLAYDILTISTRTPVDTTVAENSDDLDITKVDDSVDFEQGPDTNSPPPSNSSSSRPIVPAPEDRVPGTTLNNKAKEDLGITEPLEEEQVYYAMAVPDDTIYPQWYTTTIDAPTAWDTSTGSSSTLVAVIDTGYALDHEDLSSAWFINSGEDGNTQSGDACWTGSAESKQTNNCDDDGNGYVDDWRGWDFSNNDNNPQAGDNYAAGANHGTKSAGLVGARGNNSIGVASVNWQTQLLPLQALYDQGYGYSTDITAAIYYAVEMGADVINLSLGGPSPDSFTLAAIRYANQNNVIVVASAGNCGLNQTDPECVGYPSPGGMNYPGRYDGTIAVGASTSSDVRASFSSYGDELDIIAPGSGTIRTTSWSTSNQTSLYSTTSYGTSFSAPIVSGVVAMLKAEFPDITQDEVLALIYNSSDRVAGMGGADWHEEYGYGRLNVNNLLIEVAKYQQQLQKGAGQISKQSTTTKPFISTNRGHISSKAITSSNGATTYCVTTPGTLCTLKLDKRNSTAVVNIGPLRTNNQGIALFKWSASDASSGTWDATVTANSLTSISEKLFIQ